MSKFNKVKRYQQPTNKLMETNKATYVNQQSYKSTSSAAAVVASYSAAAALSPLTPSIKMLLLATTST